MTSVFMTPAMKGFNKMGQHPDGGFFFGGAETADASILRGGHGVIYETVTHDDYTRELVKAPFLITGTYGKSAERIGVEGYYLVNARWIHEYGRAWPKMKRNKAALPRYMEENDDVYFVDEEWFDVLPLQDIRGALRAVPLVLDAHGDMIVPPRPAGTIVLAGAVRSRLGKRVLDPIQVQAGQLPILSLSGKTTANIKPLAITPADSLGVYAATLPQVAPSVGPLMPGTSRPVRIGANARQGYIPGAIVFGAPGEPDNVAVVVESLGNHLRCWRTFSATDAAVAITPSDDPAYGRRAGELVLTEDIINVPLEQVRGAALLVTRQLVPMLKGRAGCQLFWYEVSSQGLELWSFARSLKDQRSRPA